MNTNNETITAPKVATQQEPVASASAHFNTKFSYSRRVPTLICNSMSGLSEIARWILNQQQILHIEEAHMPYYYTTVAKQYMGTEEYPNSPILIHTDSLIYTAKSIVEYYDTQVPANQRMFPVDPSANKQVQQLFDQFTTELDYYVWQYVYTEILPSRKNALAVLKEKATSTERMRASWGYGTLKKGLQRAYCIKPNQAIIPLVEIQKTFTQVNELLADGRSYLTGNTFTAADLAFAAIAAPVILPVEYGGAITDISAISEEFRQEVIALRATPAGQFVLHLYQTVRPINLSLGPVPEQPGFVKRIFNRLLIKLTSNQGPFFYKLQKRFPVINLGIVKLSVVSRHDLVVNLLERDEDFTIKEINARKMANQKGTFFLGMDRSNPQFDRERNYVRKSAHKDDLERIRTYIRQHSETLLNQQQQYGKLDVVQHFNYPVLLGILSDYFGVPAPVNAQMKRWQRTMFYDLFLNFTNNEEKHLAAVNSGKERTAWVRQLISERKQLLQEGKPIGDNLLNRLIKLQQEPEYHWVDDDCIRRNIGGLLTGIQETTSKAVIFALQELFKRPQALQGAIAAAKTHDIDAMRGYVYEALRFNPVQPGVLRYSETKQYLQGSGNKRYTIKAKHKIMALTSGAMFDPVTFTNPKEFNPHREARYMNWGFALHECYGKYINSVTIPELVAAILRLDNVQPAKGSLGRGAGLQMGPFPNNYVVTFSTKQ